MTLPPVWARRLAILRKGALRRGLCSVEVERLMLDATHHLSAALANGADLRKLVVILGPGVGCEARLIVAEAPADMPPEIFAAVLRATWGALPTSPPPTVH
jgi:hypothetical protein